MHLTRESSSIKLPIPRKGTKYIARASSHLNDSVPVVIAVRDMLKLAKTTREVKKMIAQKLLKINGKAIRDYRESIKLFNIFEADKTYWLSLLPTGKFVFKELSKKEDRLGKVINKRLIKRGVLQLNLHDGTNVLTKNKKINTGDSVYLDKKGNIVGHIPLEKGREVFIVSGKHQGNIGKIDSVDNSKINIKYSGGTAALNKSALVVLK